MRTLHQLGVFAVFLFTVSLLTYAMWCREPARMQQEVAVRMEETMADLHEWPQLIQWKTSWDGTLYAMLPSSTNQLGNLLGLLKRSQGLENGDWYEELLALAAEVMERLGIKELHNNWGDRFTLQDLENWQQSGGHNGSHQG